jgi:hypothetical protein
VPRVASFIRKVPTASGARAVQIVHKRGRRVVGIEHIGSAHDDAALAVLMEIARQQLHAGQEVLDLGAGPPAGPATAAAASGARVAATRSQLLWDALESAYARLGFEAVGDEAFKTLVLGRVIEPTSKADTLRVLADVGVPAPSLRTVFRSLIRCLERDYRGTLATACLAHSSKTPAGQVSLILYDCTTLYFETEVEDELRRVGMSKERRVDPQIQLGVLVDAAGFPLEVVCFAGNKAETRTLLPTLHAFQDRHGVTGPGRGRRRGHAVRGELNAVEDAGFTFVVGSRISKAPYDLAAHFDPARGLLQRRADPRVRPGDGHRDQCPQLAGRLPVLVQAAQARRQGDQRDDRTRREGRRRHPAAEEGPVRKDRRRHQGRARRQPWRADAHVTQSALAALKTVAHREDSDRIPSHVFEVSWTG